MPYEKQIKEFQELPVLYQSKRITDVCCIAIGVIFGLILFILACIFLSGTNIKKINFPADRNGNICAITPDSNGQTYPFLYFADIQNPMSSRYCVKQCPKQGKAPQCGFGACNIGIYPNHPEEDRLGAFCMPDDPVFKQSIKKNTNMNKNLSLLKAIDYLLIGFGISFFFGLVWMLLVQFLPKIMVWVGIILAIILLLITAVLLFVFCGSSLKQAKGWAIFFGLVCLLLIIMFAFYLIFHRKRITICGQFLSHGTQMLKKNPVTFLYVPIFIILTILFCIVVVFQYFAFSSLSSPQFDSNSLYYTIHRSWILTALLVIQTIWGLSFLRDAFGYCVSACAVQYYYKDQINCFQPVKTMFLKNLGSIFSGSFLNAFFYIPSLVVNLFCNNFDCFCCNCLDLTRRDAYAYIYLTGASYCNACRQCQYLCDRSLICRGNQSTNMVYSLAAKLVLALLTSLIIFWISSSNMFQSVIPPYLLLGIFFMCLFLTGYFVDIHIDIAQALMITFLAQYQVDQKGYLDMKVCRKQLRQIIDDIERKDLIKQSKI